MKKLITVLTFAAATFVSVSTASAQTVVQYNSAADITNNFRQTRSNANVLAFNSGNGSNGSTPGFANFGGAADNNAVRYAYDTAAVEMPAFCAILRRWVLAELNPVNLITNKIIEITKTLSYLSCR